jgi:uncharacterized membrane protein YedE/YeeE
MKILISFLVGFLFAIGLGFGGMTDANVVKGFLDILGNWNFNLIGVMFAAIAIHSVIYQLVKNKRAPLFDSQFYLPAQNAKIDKRLIVGAILFGLGWGWAGICPGPAIVSLASGKIQIVIFVASMLMGMSLCRMLSKDCKVEN